MEHPPPVGGDGGASVPGEVPEEVLPVQLPADSLLRDRRRGDAGSLGGAIAGLQFGGSQRSQGLHVDVDVGSLPRLLRQRPLLLQGGQLRLGALQLLAELEDLALLGRDGGEKVVAVVQLVEQGRGGRPRDRGRMGGGLAGGRHRGGHLGPRDGSRGQVDGEVQRQALRVSSDGGGRTRWHRGALEGARVVEGRRRGHALRRLRGIAAGGFRRVLHDAASRR